MDIPRRRPDDDPEVKARIDTAGRFGFILGLIAAISAITINFWRGSGPWEFISVAMAVLMAALNIPLGIMLGLLGEKWTRPRPKRK